MSVVRNDVYRTKRKMNWMPWMIAAVVALVPIGLVGEWYLAKFVIIGVLEILGEFGIRIANNFTWHVTLIVFILLVRSSASSIKNPSKGD